MADIDIGAVAIDRSGNTGAGLTYISKENPANVSGTITSVEIWVSTSLADCEVATFYVVSGNNFSTRDTHNIGSVTAGSKQTFSGLSMSVQAGDYIGIYAGSGAHECDTSGGTGIWYYSGDAIPCTDTTFDFIDGYDISLYGTGIILTYNYYGYNST